MGTNTRLAHTVLDIASRVTQQYQDKVNVTEEAADEDYSDAFDSVATLFHLVSAQMLHDVYKDDKDIKVINHMSFVLSEAKAAAVEALQSLEPFGFIIEVDNLY